MKWNWKFHLAAKKENTKKTKPTAIREKNKEKLKNKMQKYTKNINKKTKHNKMQKLY